MHKDDFKTLYPLKLQYLNGLYNHLKLLPHYSSTANIITVEQAQDICEMFLFGFRYNFKNKHIQREFKHANKCGQKCIMDLNSKNQGMFHNATRLFFAYLYDIEYECFNVEK